MLNLQAWITVRDKWIIGHKGPDQEWTWVGTKDVTVLREAVFAATAIYLVLVRS